MQRLTRSSTAHPRAVAAVWLALTLLGVWAATGLGDALSVSSGDLDRPGFATNREIARAFGTGGQLPPIVAVADGADVRGGAAREDLRRATERLEAAVPGSRTTSYATSGDRALVSRDGRTAYVLLYAPPGREAPDENPEALAAARRAADGLRVGGRPVRVTGVAALQDDSGGGGAGLLVETLVGGLGALVVLAVVFASPLAFVPLLIAVASILTTFLVVRGLAELTEVSFVVRFLVGLIGLGVAIDYSLVVVVRWREERAAGASDAEAVRTAMATAGHAVAVSGLTVAIGLLALVVVPVPFIRSIGYGGLLIPLVSVAAALTLLPAILGTVGPRLDRRRGARASRGGGRWERWARFVVRRRVPAAALGLAVLLALTAVATTLRPGRPAVDALSSGGEARTALRALERSGLGDRVLTPVELLLPAEVTARELRAVTATRGVLGGTAPDGPQWRRPGARLAIVRLADDATSRAGQATLDRLADLPAPLRVGGPDVQDRELSRAIYGAFPAMVVLLAVLTFALLAWSLRSVVLPLKAVALNVLSVGTAFGVVVLVWQQGHGSQLIGGVPATGTITNWVPLAIFAFLYGLSMDYEVFLLTRMREAHDEGKSTREAVVDGLARTGGVVTSAALILCLAVGALAAAPATELRILATGLAAGILLDATVVRALVVPALVVLLGEANWWAPRWLRRDRSVAGADGRGERVETFEVRR